jgi:type I restriction enzyme S subunit
LSHLMKTLKFDLKGHERQWISKYSQQEVLVPSYDIQLKIVSILDKFETLTNSLKEGLPKEIELRHKQYEYYRNKLLNFNGGLE